MVSNECKHRKFIELHCEDCWDESVQKARTEVIEKVLRIVAKKNLLHLLETEIKTELDNKKW